MLLRLLPPANQRLTPLVEAAVSAAVISSPRCKKKQRTMISSTSVAGGDDNEEGPLTQLWNQEYYEELGVMLEAYKQMEES